MIKKALIVFAALMLLSLPVKAEDSQDYKNVYSDTYSSTIDTDSVEDAVPDSAEDIVGDLDVTNNLDFGAGLSNIVDSGLDMAGGFIKKGLRSAMLILVIVMLCALASNFYDKNPVTSYITMAGCMAITVVAVGDLNSLIGLGTESIAEIEQFSKALLPALTAASAASGSPMASTARYIATTMFFDVLMTIISRILLPLLYFYIAACAAKGAIGNDSLGKVADLFKWVISSALKIIVLIFTFYIGVSGIISGSADSATVRATKLTFQSAFPVVGSILSDASELVLVGFGIVRNSVGVFGMLVVLAICLSPFLQLGIHYLLYKLSAGLASTLTDGKIVSYIESLGSAFGLIMGMTGACCIMMFISVVSAIKAVTP